MRKSLYICEKQKQMINPFFITGLIPERYFCDREQETEKIIVALENRSHILLTSSRRMGKTQLIRHVFEQDAIKGKYYTFYSDIFSTSTLKELVFALGREIYKTLVPGEKKALSLFLGTIKSIAAGFSVDPVTGAPKVNLQLGDIYSPELTLEEIFSYLEKADKRCIFAIDEFQQIASYPEKNVEALLRTHIQAMNNCCFIFSGSNRHILEQMFSSYARPFYNSAKPLHLERIDREKYAGFVVRNFKDAGIRISVETAHYCYDLLDGCTYYMHKVFHDIFSYSEEGSEVTCDRIDSAIKSILEENTYVYGETLARMGISAKQLLIAIAKTGRASRLTSGAFVKKHALSSPSSVQKAMRTLLDMQMITYDIQGPKNEKVFLIPDKFLDIWLRNNYS